MTKQKKDKLAAKIETWTDEECLLEFVKFFPRVNLSTEFVQDSDGLIVAEVLTMMSGDKKIVSEPFPLEWPLQPVPLPEDVLEEYGVKLN